MLHRLHPRRPSRIPEWAAILVAAVATLFLVFYAPPTSAAGQAEVSYVDPQRFTDARRNPSDRARALQSLTAHLQKLAARLPDGQLLRVEVLDVDLAGVPYPSRTLADDTRILLGGADAPRIQLRWALVEGGRTLRQGEDGLTNLAYLDITRFDALSAEDLPHEKRMLSAWFADRFGAASR